MQLSVPTLPPVSAAPGTGSAVSTDVIPEAALEGFGAVLLAATQPPAPEVVPPTQAAPGGEAVLPGVSVEPHAGTTQTGPSTETVRTGAQVGPHLVPTRSAPSPDSVRTVSRPGPHSVPTQAEHVPEEGAEEPAKPIAVADVPVSNIFQPQVTAMPAAPATPENEVVATEARPTTTVSSRVAPAAPEKSSSQEVAQGQGKAAVSPVVTTTAAAPQSEPQSSVPEALLPEIAAVARTFTRSAPAARPENMDTAAVPVRPETLARAQVAQAEVPSTPVSKPAVATETTTESENEIVAAISPEARRSIDTYRAFARGSGVEAHTTGGHPENIAVSTPRADVGPVTPEKAVKNNDLVASKQQVAKHEPVVGTRAANPSEPMPVLFSHDYVSPVFRAEPLPNVTVAPVAFETVASEAAGETEQVATARRAIATTLETVQQFSTADARGVNLKFSVSGTDLAVHVALRGGEIQTTFRTESPELRAALATEWRSVTAQFDAGAQRLAEPVFSANPASSSMQADAGASHREGRSAQQQQEAPTTPFRFSTAERESAAPAQPAAPAISITPAPLPSTRRLHAFA